MVVYYEWCYLLEVIIWVISVCFQHIIYCFKTCDKINQIHNTCAVLPRSRVKNSISLLVIFKFLRCFHIFPVSFRIFIFFLEFKFGYHLLSFLIWIRRILL